MIDDRFSNVSDEQLIDEVRKRGFIIKDAKIKNWKKLSEKEHTEIAIDCGCASADWVFYGAAVENAVIQKNMIDDTNLAQCEYCGYVTDRDDIEYVPDPFCSDGTVTRCPECNEGESFYAMIGCIFL